MQRAEALVKKTTTTLIYQESYQSSTRYIGIISIYDTRTLYYDRRFYQRVIKGTKIIAVIKEHTVTKIIHTK